MDAQGCKPQWMYYTVSMQGLATTGRIEAGFALLTRAEANGLLSHHDHAGYPILHIFVQACRLVGDFSSASRVQAVLDRLGLIALAPVASALVQGSLWKCSYGDRGEGVGDARQLFLQLRQQMAYKPQLHAVPWGLVQNSTHKQQEESLQLHAEKKTLAMQLSHGEAELNASINFKACMDCHEFFKITSQWLGRRILLRQPQMTHAFTDGHCSCNDQWCWEMRLKPAKQTTTLAAPEKQELDAAGAKKRRKAAKHAAATIAGEELHSDAVEDKKRSKVVQRMAAAVVVFGSEARTCMFQNIGSNWYPTDRPTD